MKVLVAILNWRNYEDSLLSIKSVMDSSINADIMLIDNDSRDGSLEDLERYFGNSIKYHSNKRNLGFSYGNNPALRECLNYNYDFLLLLNNDAKIHPDGLEIALEFLEKRADVGICGMKLVDMDTPHKIQAIGGGYINLFGVARHITESKNLRRLSYITGAAALIRRQVIEDIGLMDESYFMYWEDVDYSFRARKAGWKLDVSQQSLVFHRESSSAGLRSDWQIKMKNRSAILFAKKFYGIIWRLYYIGAIARIIKAKAAKI